MSTPAFAASGINPAESQVLKMLEKGAKYNEDFYQYANALRVYFNRDSISISQIQADDACEHLLEIIRLYENEGMSEGKFLDKFQYVLMYIGVRISYNRADSTADFIGADGSVVMSNLNLKNADGGKVVSLTPIKQTGNTYTAFTTALLFGGAALAVAIVTGALWIVLRRKGNHQQ